MMVKVGSDFSGVGAFDQALIRLGIEHETVFSCDMDKYARQTYTLNFGEPAYYPMNVYDREIPSESLDIYMSSPPCQAFSLAGKRKGEADKRGILFYNTHEFICKNRPRYFIIENVKGLLSDVGGKTFQNWLDLLGGKSINGKTIMFPNEDAAPYHIHYQVLNAKHYGVPQNRERVFIVGIRDDEDNNFRFPAKVPLTKRLRDVLESEVDEKYYLSESLIDNLLTYNERQIENGRGFSAKFRDVNKVGIMDALKVGGGGKDDLVMVQANTKQGYEIATAEDSINFSVPNSKTRRGRVGKGVAQTLDTACNHGVLIGAIRGRNPENPKSSVSGLETQQMLEINENGTSNAITTVQKDNVVVEGDVFELRHDEGIRMFNGGVCGTIRTIDCGGEKHTMQNSRIRRLTPTECFRLMDFNPAFIERTINSGLISDSQLYKQAGNSIVVACLVGIIKNLKLA